MKNLSLFDAFKNAMLANPAASRKEAFSHFLETVRSDPKWLDIFAEDYFYRMAAHWEPAKVGDSSMLVGTPAAKRRAEISNEYRKENERRVDEELEASKNRIRKVTLLDQVMPNGEKARFCTFAELAKFGGFWTEVSRKGKGTEVLDKKLGENDLQNIWSRYLKGKWRRVA